MTTSSSYRVFVSSVSRELSFCREEVARVLRRKGIEVRDEKHFRQHGATMLDALHNYISECDAVVCLIGEQCGSLPSDVNLTQMGGVGWVDRFLADSGQPSVSYTQWEYLLAKSLGKKTYVFFTHDPFEPERDAVESATARQLQSDFRAWVQGLGQQWEALTDVSTLIENILVLPFPDKLKGKPSNLPQPSLGTLFKGREGFLKKLHETPGIGTRGTTAITDKADPKRARALSGSGGIGKTRTAIEYAWRYADDYTALLFLSAQDAQRLDSGLAGLTDVLGIDGLAAESTDAQRIGETLNWLGTHPGWLLILDNVDTDNAAAAVKACLPQLTRGRVLITSRLRQWSAAVNTLDLGLLDLKDARQYLLEATEADRTRSDQDDELAQQVAVKTGQLALGLEHAAAWINAQYAGFADYLAQWDQDEAAILESFDGNQIDYPHELLVTWNLSVDELDDDARHLLEVLSWLAPEPVPDAFFAAAPDDGQATQRKSIATLTKYSLANRIQQEDQRGFQVHRLVQATTRLHQKRTGQRDLPALDSALSWTNAAFTGDPGDVRDWPDLDLMADHVDAVCQFGYDEGKTNNHHATASLLNQLGRLHLNKARYADAEPLMRRALTIDETSFGKDHPNVAIRLNNLAQLLKATNRLAEAEPLMRRALTIDETSFGKDHPKVAIRLNNLAQLLKATNRLAEAEPLMRRALTIDETSFGDDHPNVAIDLNNLAQLLKATNRLAEAEPLMRRALTIDETSFGKDHPEVARDLNNLAQLLKATNRLAEAEPLMRRALTIDETSFGKDHPKVAIRLNNLAQLLQATNRLAEAEPLMRRALTIDETSFGKDHPKVATDLNNLAQLLQATNRLAEAEPLMRRALTINETSFGADHPKVAIRLNNLAQLLQATNRLAEAEPLMRRALTIDETSFGKDHPEVATDLNNLAQLLQATNRLAEAEPLMRRGVQILHHFSQITGHTHSDTSTVQNNYTGLLLKMGLPKKKVDEKIQSLLTSTK